MRSAGAHIYPHHNAAVCDRVTIVCHNKSVQKILTHVLQPVHATSRPPPLPKNKEKYREEILDRVEEGWLGEELARTMPQLISELLQLYLHKKPDVDSRAPRYRRNMQADGMKCVFNF